MSYSWGVSAGPGRTGRFAPLHEAVGITTVSGDFPTPAAVSPDAAASDTAAPVVAASGEPDEPAAEPPVSLELRRLAAELAPMVDVWRRLLLQHLPDTAGRCRTCTKGGTGLPTTRWPCSIHGIAELARRCHDVQHHDPKSA